MLIHFPKAIRTGIIIYKKLKGLTLEQNQIDIMVVVKRANTKLREIRDTLKTNEDVKNFYIPYYEKVKENCESLDFFITICLTDLQYNFIGGSIINNQKS
jgi:hypothetical protein